MGLADGFSSWFFEGDENSFDGLLCPGSTAREENITEPGRPDPGTV